MTTPAPQKPPLTMGKVFLAVFLAIMAALAVVLVVFVIHDKETKDNAQALQLHQMVAKDVEVTQQLLDVLKIGQREAWVYEDLQRMKESLERKQTMGTLAPLQKKEVERLIREADAALAARTQ